MSELILLAEDNENDVVLTKLAFERAKVDVDLRHVPNGEDCLAFLRKQGKYADAPTPDLILLDLNMPRMDGLQVMREIHADPKLAHLVIVVLTSSSTVDDVNKSYSLGASSYLVKPINFEDFSKMIDAFCRYWFSFVVLPPTGSRLRTRA